MKRGSGPSPRVDTRSVAMGTLRRAYGHDASCPYRGSSRQKMRDTESR